MVQPSKMNNEKGVVEKDLRPLHCELNSLSRSDGTAIFAQGTTCVIAAIIGPAEVKQQNLSIEKAYIECNFRPKSGLPSLRDKIRETLLGDVFESVIYKQRHPRSLISIQIQELEDRCGLEACAINGACMALLMAGTPMNYTVAAVHCIVTNDGELILDPDDFEYKDHKNSFTFVFDSVNKDLLTINTTGAFKMAELTAAEMMCRAASEKIFNFYRTTIEEYYGCVQTMKAIKSEADQVEKMDTK